MCWTRWAQPFFAIGNFVTFPHKSFWVPLEKFLLLCNPLYADYWNTLNNSFSSIFSISKTFGYLTPHLLELDYFRLKEKLFNPVHLFYVARFFSKICVLCSFITVENWVVLLLILHFSKRGFYFYMWYNLPTNVT